MPTAEEIYLFRHAAYRDVAYRLQIPSDRAELHALALEIMEEVFHFDIEKFSQELAEHARHAREQGASEIPGLAVREARYVMQAVKRAEARAQWSIVNMLADHALACPALDMAGRLDAMNHRAHALRSLGRISESESLSLEVSELARSHGNERLRLQSMLDAAAVRISRGALAEGVALLDQAEPLAQGMARQGDPQLLTGLYIQHSLAATHYEEVERWLQKADEAIAQHTDTSVYAAVQGNKANLLGALGRHEEAAAILTDLVQVFTKLDEIKSVSVCWANLGRQQLMRGERELAEAALGKAIQTASEVGNSRTEAFARANLATLQIRRGALDAAAANLERAINISRDHELHAYHAAYLCSAAELSLLLGHELEAQQHVEHARAEFHAAGSDAFTVEYCGTMRLRIAASQAVSTGRPGRATASVAVAPPSPMWLPVVRELLEQVREEAAARGERPGLLLEEGVKFGSALLHELESAIAEQRPALVFRGHLPGELRPSLRAELLKRMTDGEKSTLKSLHPGLWEALQA